MVPKKATHVHFSSYLKVTKATEISDLDPLTFDSDWLLTETDRQLLDVEGRLYYRRTPMTCDTGPRERFPRFIAYKRNII